MTKWADYLISAVSYNPNREIIEVQAHEDLDGRMGPAEIVDKLTVAHNMRKGNTYVTVFRMLNTWKRGDEVNLFSVGGQPYLRIDRNKVNLDNLGGLPDIDYKKKELAPPPSTIPTGDREAGAPPALAPAPEPQPKPEPKPEPEPEPEPASTRGALPAEGEIEIPFEDIQPEPVADAPEPEPPKVTKKAKVSDQEFLDYELDYLRRLEEQRKQEEEAARQAAAEKARLDEIERQARLQREEEERQRHKIAGSKPSEASTSTRGSLPAEGEIEIPFEDIQPEPVADTIREPAPDSTRGSLPAEGEIEIPFEDEQPVDPTMADRDDDQEIDLGENGDDDEPTPEQLARFEDLENQLEEIIRQSAQGNEELPDAAGELQHMQQEAEPEPAEVETTPAQHTRQGTEKQAAELEPQKPQLGQDDAVSRQYEQISELSDKIKELETALANAPRIGTEPDAEPAPQTVEGMLERFDKTADEQIEQLARLEEHITEIESYDVESELISKLHKQMEKLNKIEERLSGSQGPTQEQLDRAAELERQIAELGEKQRLAEKAASEVVAYCMKCRDKRGMSDPEETRMKNDKHAIRGMCSVCGTKMFKIVGSGTKKKKPVRKAKDFESPTQAQLDRVATLEKQIRDIEDRMATPTVTAYCVRCRDKREMIGPKQSKMKNGRHAIRGTCPVCGTKMFRMGKMPS